MPSRGPLTMKEVLPHTYTRNGYPGWRHQVLPGRIFPPLARYKRARELDLHPASGTIPA